MSQLICENSRERDTQTFFECSLFHCLSSGEDGLDKDANVAFWGVSSSNNGEAKSLFAMTLLKDNSVEGEVEGLRSTRKCGGRGGALGSLGHLQQTR